MKRNKKLPLLLAVAALLSALCIAVAGAEGSVTTITPDNSGNGSGTLAITLDIAPQYTITAADTTPATDKKYHYGEDITIAVKVSGANFEGGEFTLNYDSATLEVKTFPANNKVADSEQTAGSVKFEALTKEAITDGQALATITFTVKTQVTTETVCNFTFEGTPKICYTTGADSLAATVTPGKVTVEPVTYAVTLTPSPSGLSDFTLTGDNGVASVDNAKAVDGQPYAVTIGGYNATEYEYAVTLTVGGSDATAPTISDGVLTIPAASVTGAIVLTVTRTTKHVTPTLTVNPEGAFDLSGVTTISSDKTTNDAIKGLDYVVTIGSYSEVDYEYGVALDMTGNENASATRDGATITIAGGDITGDFTLTVTRTTKHVTPTLKVSPEGEFSLSGVTTKPDTTTVTDAIKGLNYVVTISSYSAVDYEYDVTLNMTGNASATAPTPDNDGKLTIAGGDITGDFTLTVTRTTKHVTANLNGVTGSNDAIKGVDYSATIDGYDTANYTYAVTLTMNGASATAPTPDTTGKLTITGTSITGDFTLTVTRTTKHVTASLDGVTGSNDAIKGVDYTATIDGYDTANYTYAVTLTMNSVSATAPEPDANGVLKIEGNNITGDFTLSVTRTLANFTVTTTADYVTGWTLVTVAKASGREDTPVYNYDSKPMYYVNAYSAYAYLAQGSVTESAATEKVSLGTSAAGMIAAGYDVNNTGKVDYSDTLLTYRCYEVVQTPSDATMETYLRADVNGSKKVDTTDVSGIDSHRTPESGS